MIAEALKFIADLKAASIEPHLIETGDSRRLAWLVGDKVVNHELWISPRKHQAHDIDTIVRLANRFDECTFHDSIIWISDTEITLVTDDDDHRVNTVTCPLVITDVFCLLESLAIMKPWHDQRAFVRLLRIDLAGTLPPGILLDRVRKLKFEGGTVTTGQVAKDRESMGRQIHAAVSGEGDIPDEVPLLASVFRGHDRFDIVCSVDVDPARNLLQLAPLPDEIERVKRLAVKKVQELIVAQVSESVPVYLGKP